MKSKILIAFLSFILFINVSCADVTYDYSPMDIFDPVIDKASQNFHLDSYTIITILIFIVIILAIIFASSLIKKILYEPFKKRNVFSYNVSNRKIKSIDPTLDVNEFKNSTFDLFKNTEEAFSNFNYNFLKENLTTDLYNDKVLELDSFKKRNLRNILSDFTLNYIQINNITIVNNIKKVDVILTSSFKDYIVSEGSLDTVMSGSKRDTQERTYLLTLEENIEEKTCIKCGGEIQNGVCLYCRFHNEQKEFNWVLGKIKVLKQRTIGK